GLREGRGSNRLGRCALVRSSPKHDELWSNAGQIGILLLAGMVPLPPLGAISAVCCGFALVVPSFFQGVCELVHTCAPSGATNSKKGRCQDTAEPYHLRNGSAIDRHERTLTAANYCRRIGLDAATMLVGADLCSCNHDTLSPTLQYWHQVTHPSPSAR